MRVFLLNLLCLSVGFLETISAFLFFSIYSLFFSFSWGESVFLQVNFGLKKKGSRVPQCFCFSSQRLFDSKREAVQEDFLPSTWRDKVLCSSGKLCFCTKKAKETNRNPKRHSFTAALEEGLVWDSTHQDAFRQPEANFSFKTPILLPLDKMITQGFSE